MSQPTAKLRIVCISDTHNQTPNLPPGDILIHAGDLTNQGTLHELDRSIRWLQSQTAFKARIVVAGNHDVSLDDKYSGADRAKEAGELMSKAKDITYLCHESTRVRIPVKDGEVAVNVFGSPYSRASEKWAFGYADEEEARELWGPVPDDTDVLVTHGPPLGICDIARDGIEDGCGELLQTLRRVRPRLHVCGHRHEGRGGQWLWWSKHDGVVEQSMVWTDPGASSKKLSLMDLTGRRQGLGSWSEVNSDSVNARLDVARRKSSAMDRLHKSQSSASHEADGNRSTSTCVLNAAIMAKSYVAGVPKQFNKPIVVDINFPILQACDV
jgi:hypothetical protein